MNKNIKKTIALALALGTLSVAGPAKYMNLFVTEAHASTSSADELTSLDLETSSGTSLDLYTDSSYDDELDDDDLSVGDTYYAKTSATKVTINSIDGADDDNVRIFKGSSSTAYEVGDDISISSGTTTTLKVRVYEDEYDSSEDYSSSDYNQYTIVVKNTTDSDSDSDSDSDADLLGLAVSNGTINFNPSTTSYDVSVPTNADSTIIQANPKDSDDTVTINGSTVTSTAGYKKTITLSSTSTTVTVKVTNDDDSKTYTLNIKKTSNATQGQAQGQQGQQAQGQQGQQGQQAQGQQGQGANNGAQSSSNGQKGWQQTNSTWYYYDNSGQKKTGWMQDTTGKWYYLNTDGSMAHDTTVGGYKIGSDGAWVQ